jgi:hypothetical protein
MGVLSYVLRIKVLADWGDRKQKRQLSASAVKSKPQNCLTPSMRLGCALSGKLNKKVQDFRRLAGDLSHLKFGVA